MNGNGFYRIGELASMFGITPRTIRYYEELGLLEPLNRNEGEHRHYSGRDAVKLKRIHQLKDYGLSLAEIQELFDLAREDRSGKKVRESLIGKYKERLVEAEKRRSAIDQYIDDLSWHIEQLEKTDDFYNCPGSACTNCQWAERCDMRILVKSHE